MSPLGIECGLRYLDPERLKPVAQQRQLLRKLVPDRIAVTPHVRGDRKWVDWHGSMALAPIVSGITPALGDALLVGRRWWPQEAATTWSAMELRGFLPRAA